MSEIMCNRCGCRMAGYDHVIRKVKVEFGKTIEIRVPRAKCPNCGRVKRILPNEILPYKQFRRDIVIGFMDGTKSYYELEYEDYPCEVTVKRWRKDGTNI